MVIGKYNTFNCQLALFVAFYIALSWIAAFALLAFFLRH